MSAARILPVTVRNAGDLAKVCAGENAKSDPLWERAVKAKRQWARDRLSKLGTFAWIAYDGAEATGMIQCHPERTGIDVCVIDCLWVPRKTHWGRGIGTKLLAEVESTMQRQHRWFDGKPADGLAAMAFHGEAEGQQSAESFYLSHGFAHVDGDPDLMFRAFRPDVAWIPLPHAETAPISLPGDEERITIVLGPLSCPFVYRMLAKTGAYAGEKLGLPVVELDSAEDPEGYAARGGRPGVLARGRVIRHDLWQREELDKELEEL